MNPWIWILIILGGFILVGVMMDIIAKRRGQHIDPDGNTDHMSDSLRNEAEQHADKLRNNMDDFL
ncbi:MAG TPA: hypothetical protein VF199_02165 [Bacillales bacterium]